MTFPNKNIFHEFMRKDKCLGRSSGHCRLATLDEAAKIHHDFGKEILVASHVMSAYIGLDVHKDWTFATVLDHSGQVVAQLLNEQFQVSLKSLMF
jgi:hypothetical protein